jgi:hypothetical protein
MTQGETRHAVQLEAPLELLTALSERVDSPEVVLGTPTGVEHPAEALDAPFSAKKAATALALVTALFNTGTAGVKFADAVHEQLKDHQDVTVRVYDPQSGARIGELSSQSSREEIRRVMRA